MRDTLCNNGAEKMCNNSAGRRMHAGDAIADGMHCTQEKKTVSYFEICTGQMMANHRTNLSFNLHSSLWREKNIFESH